MLSLNNEDAYFEDFFPQLVEWYVNETGILITYSKF